MNASESHQPLARQADMRWLLRHMRNHWRPVSAAIGFGALGGLASALEPYLIGVIVDQLLTRLDLNLILRDILILVGLAVFSLVAFFLQRYYSGKVANDVHYDMRQEVFDNMLRLDNAFYQRHAAGDLISRMFSDLQWVWRLLAIGTNRGGSALFSLITAFVLLGSVSLPLTLVVFSVLAVSTALQMRAGLGLARLTERVQDQAGVLSAMVQDTASGIQTIKSFGREADTARAFARLNADYRQKWIYFKRRNEPVGMLPQLIANVVAGVVVLVGGMLTLNGAMSLGNFTQFLFYLSFISKALLEIGTIYQRYAQTRGSIRRLTLLLSEPRIYNAPAPRPLAAPRGEVRFEQVNYTAPDGAQLLYDINLTIPSGSVVAIVGATGCGKTLLVNLLARVMDASSGRVLMDGVDVRDIHLDDLRQAIAYVPQATFLFSMPLRENVRMGNSDLDDLALDSAVHISRLSNDLAQLPQGLETLVGERGVLLSGGQRQRVAIARAIAHDPAILVLDDALSSVDTSTASEILHDLRDVLRTRTSILIAHRIGTVREADMIVVMDEGRIVETGTHQALLQKDGFYARMVARETAQEHA